MTRLGEGYIAIPWGSIAFRVPDIRGYFFGGPYSQDYSILGPILRPPYVRKLPDNISRDIHTQTSRGSKVRCVVSGFRSTLCGSRCRVRG